MGCLEKFGWTLVGENLKEDIHNSQCYLNLKRIEMYSKTCLKWPPLRKPKIGFQDQLLVNAGQKYCRMLQGEHSAILLTFIKLRFVIKISVMSIFEWPLKTGFTVHVCTPRNRLRSGGCLIFLSNQSIV